MSHPIPLRDLPRIAWEAFPALLMPVILLGCLYSGATTPTEAAAAAAMYALAVSAFVYRVNELARRLHFSAEQRAHHHFDRDADRGSNGLQLCHYDREHSQGTGRHVEGLGAVAICVPAARQHSPSDAWLRAGGNDHLAGLCACPAARCVCAWYRSGAFRRHGRGQCDDRPVLAALRSAVVDDGQDHRRAAQGHRAGNVSLSRRHDRCAHPDHLHPVADARRATPALATRADVRRQV